MCLARIRRLLIAGLLPACWALCEGSAGAAPAEFPLAQDGKPAATIIVAQSPVHAAAFAAWELQDHVRRITGAVLPIVSDTAAVEGPRILVGRSAATDKLGLEGGDLKSQEYLIRFLPAALVLLGKLMQQAEAAAQTDAQKQRVALFRQGVWEHMLEGRRRWLAKQKP